eukprot:4864730-Pleurochrysis_carterae.AAC.1
MSTPTAEEPLDPGERAPPVRQPSGTCCYAFVTRCDEEGIAVIIRALKMRHSIELPQDGLRFKKLAIQKLCFK